MDARKKIAAKPFCLPGFAATYAASIYLEATTIRYFLFFWALSSGNEPQDTQAAYSRILGSLQYPAIFSKPDCSQSRASYIHCTEPPLLLPLPYFQYWQPPARRPIKFWEAITKKDVVLKKKVSFAGSF